VFSCNSETVPNAPKRKEMHQNMSLGSIGVDRERRCEKFRHDFVARTFPLIAPVWHVLRQVSCSSKTVPNAPKRKETHQNMSLGSNGMNRECCCEKFWHDFVARTFALLSPVWRVLQQVSCCRETVPNAPKRKETHQNMSLGSNGVDRERRCEKFRHNFVARTFALLSPVWRVLQYVSCSSKTVTNAPNHKETHQNMCLGSNGVDQECLLRKILTWLRGTNFCINCTSFARFHSLEKRTQMHPNKKQHTKTCVLGPMVWIVIVRCEKLWHDFVARTFTLIARVWRVMHHVSCSSETVPNAPYLKETHENMSLGSNGVDREHTLRKIPTRLRGTNFYINCTCLARFRAIAKWSQMLTNGKKRTKTWV